MGKGTSATSPPSSWRLAEMSVRVGRPPVQWESFGPFRRGSGSVRALFCARRLQSPGDATRPLRRRRETARDASRGNHSQGGTCALAPRGGRHGVTYARAQGPPRFACMSSPLLGFQERTLRSKCEFPRRWGPHATSRAKPEGPAVETLPLCYQQGGCARLRRAVSTRPRSPVYIDERSEDREEDGRYSSSKRHKTTSGQTHREGCLRG